MAITKKPSNNHIKNEKLTETIINKGGASPSYLNDDRNENIKVTIRLTTKMIDIIDNYLKSCINKKTRTSWIREAVEEKIKKDITEED